MIIYYNHLKEQLTLIRERIIGNLKRFSSLTGFTYTRACKLTNTSEIPMTYRLRVPTDGTGLPAAQIAEAFLLGETLHLNSNRPVEFQIDDSFNVLGPNSQAEINVFNFCYYI